jgi:hypothetical protein
VLIEAAEAVPYPVYVGHSTGGMYLLSTPALEEALVGLALVSTAPDARWLPEFVAMTERHPLPEVVAATAAYEQDPTDENLGALAVCSAAWNFSPGTVEAGAALLARMPYNGCCLHRPSRRHHRGPWAQGWVIRRCVVGSAAFLHHGRTGGRRRWRAGLR